MVKKDDNYIPTIEELGDKARTLDFRTITYRDGIFVIKSADTYPSRNWSFMGSIGNVEHYKIA